MSETIAAIATGTARCAIGIVRLSGSDALAICDKVFFPACGKALSTLRERSLFYGEFRSSGTAFDLGMACAMRAPHSYTGEDTVEFYCHGSQAVLAEALNAVYAAGARPALAGEFTKRAFLNGRMDLTEAEAVIDLIDAQTVSAAKNAVRGLKGGIGVRLHEMREELLDMLTHFYAVVDYPDEELPPFLYEHAARTLSHAAQALGALADTFERGRALQDGVPCAILGRPNAGKSSLLNALCGRERAIVTPIAGTTRDVIEERIRLGDTVLRICDTAGIRSGGDTVERIGIERALRAAEEAELILCVFDGAQALSEEDRHIISCTRGKPAVAIINKTDLPQLLKPEDLAADFSQIFTLSAQTGEGIGALCSALEEMFPAGSEADIIITNARQAALLHNAADVLTAAARGAAQGVTPDAVLSDVERAAGLLGEITGETAGVDLVSGIFSRFCVGK